MKLLLAPFVWTWNGLRRLGRIALWILFWPAGLWRSIRHGKEKDLARLEAAQRRR